MLDELDKRIISIMQDEFPLVPKPYLEIANKLGIREEELLERLKKYTQSGKIRKMGAVLKHREVGYAANALCAWIIPEDRIEEIGKIFSKFSAVTHCYARVTRPDWPYNFYTMLHANTREQCNSIAEELAQQAGVGEYVMLFSTKEWKKNSMKYFR